jgi:CheY-like chemotaxis protein
MRQVFNLTKLQAEEKELRFLYEATTSLPQYVKGDERKLRQILLNLLSNAVKYTRKGGVTLRVAYDHANDGILRCEVTDTGIGIPQEKLEAVFDQFTQLATNRQVREGTGLGLNITKRLLTLMHGTIRVESAIGSGSTFFMELPLPQILEMDIDLDKLQQHSIIGYQGERKSILVVDDNINNTSMLVSLLDPLGFSVSTAENGRLALQSAVGHVPDLVIMDLVMPDIDGFEAARAIRNSPELSGTKIIGASATVTDSTYKEAFMSICDAFVTKPIQIDLLLERIREQLGLTWNRAQTDHQTSTHTIEHGDSLVEREIPPQDKLKVAYELALLGDVRKIQAWATQLAIDDPQYRFFADRILELASTYRTKAILALLGEQMEKKGEC